MAATNTQQMKAIIQPDKTSHALILTQKPIPIPTHPQDVLVRVHATAPCKGELDWALYAPEYILPSKILIPGQDLAGSVLSAPEGSKFKIGDSVYARIEANRPGAGAEYALPRESELALKPKNLSWIETAATPLSSLTAYQALFTQGNICVAALAGDQIAKNTNANLRVLITSASSSNIGFVRSLGATEIIDYTDQDISDWVAYDQSREVDLIIDTIGGPSLAYSWHAVREGGNIISVCGFPEQNRPDGVTKKANSSFYLVNPKGTDLDSITHLIEADRVKPIVDSVVEFDDFAKAWEKVEAGHTRGKVVVKISGGM
ncbi:zinc-binding dehydrogenase domain-containing protein [Trichoderma breve]|uniref:Zinc-binding dehydrogenase domain-containing protein n=1 Tax=Trichoderma breve TaxID=2034170 RepID=A0A9W9E7T9_9HYPO|nr:zinc-binding dehydrogenase domain-containing protein [Trichoderma breve]KAJ4861274.1 zinc-binding dehydrogenase domain-containing protein [Trichoderma breve]